MIHQVKKLEKWPWYFIPLALIALNFILRWWYIREADIALDEPFSATLECTKLKRYLRNAESRGQSSFTFSDRSFLGRPVRYRCCSCTESVSSFHGVHRSYNLFDRKKALRSSSWITRCAALYILRYAYVSGS